MHDKTLRIWDAKYEGRHGGESNAAIREEDGSRAKDGTLSLDVKTSGGYFNRAGLVALRDLIDRVLADIALPDADPSDRQLEDEAACKSSAIKHESGVNTGRDL